MATIDAFDETPPAQARLETAPRAVAAGASAVWVACADQSWLDWHAGGPIARIDPGSGQVVRIIESAGWAVDDLAVANGKLMATMHQRVGTLPGGG